MKLFVLLSFVLAACQTCNARIYERCSLARDLVDRGVPRAAAANWVCIVQTVSRFNTADTGPLNPDGSRDWGLFRINDRHWCDPQDGRSSANGCGVPCTSLTIDDIGIALRCAQQIRAAQGFAAWNVWNNECARGANVRSVDDCF